ncbi:MAG: hypothetical protein KDA80_10865 [Planctomycetaceae bacterium]|nr:hypothetical protein [Planctomycetaceae bacterium]
MTTKSSNNPSDILSRITSDSRYTELLDWGEPRPGHPEGTVRAHIAELEGNLARLSDRLTEDEQSKLRLLIHTHDTFKGSAQPGVAITHPQSHASLARAFLEEFCDDDDLLAMVQYHDEPYALWRQFRQKGTYSAGRMDGLIASIHDWDLFLAFNLVDGCTKGKDRKPIRWFLQELGNRVSSKWSEQDIL